MPGRSRNETAAETPAETTTGAARGRGSADHEVDGPSDVNRIVLEGRLSQEPEEKSLPSGDVLVVLRVVVRRPDGARVDSIEVAVGPPPARGHRRAPGQALTRTVRRSASLRAGDRVRVEGHLERRFWRAGGAPRTRMQVVASEVEPVTATPGPPS
jgi:single-strand DNA-binding protein